MISYLASTVHVFTFVVTVMTSFLQSFCFPYRCCRTLSLPDPMKLAMWHSIFKCLYLSMLRTCCLIRAGISLDNWSSYRGSFTRLLVSIMPGQRHYQPSRRESNERMRKEQKEKEEKMEKEKLTKRDREVCKQINKCLCCQIKNKNFHLAFNRLTIILLI